MWRYERSVLERIESLHELRFLWCNVTVLEREAVSRAFKTTGGMKTFRWLLPLLIVQTISPVSVLAEIPGFPETGLEDRIAFWEKVFTIYGRDDLIIHDRERVNLIYDVVDEKSRRAGVARVRRLLNEVRRSIDTPEGFSAQARVLYDRIEAEGVRMTAGNIAVLMNRIHVQRGIKERFRIGVIRSGRYLPYFEEVLESEGVPPILALLPLVESSYENAAYSHAGAAGIWQFTPATGRLYMRVARGRDDRLNPAIATRAAAKLLRGNYEQLQSWPLAISAYNHGRAGMLRARSLHGSDMAEIVRKYRGRTFKYASKNFYPEFLAAVRVYQNYEGYFGPLTLDRPLDFSEGAARIMARAPPERGDALRHRVRPGDTLSQIARRYGTSVRALMALNRLPSDQIFAGETLVVGPGSPQVSSDGGYRVQWGDTLSHIARMFGLGIRELMELNGLRNSRIYTGQVLIVR